MEKSMHGHPRLLKIGMLIAGIGSLGAFMVIVVTALEIVRSARGLDAYRPLWAAEFNSIGFLVVMSILAAAIIVRLWLGFLEWRGGQGLAGKARTREP
jgi:hypothetical protein